MTGISDRLVGIDSSSQFIQGVIHEMIHDSDENETEGATLRTALPVFQALSEQSSSVHLSIQLPHVFYPLSSDIIKHFMKLDEWAKSQSNKRMSLKAVRRIKACVTSGRSILELQSLLLVQVPPIENFRLTQVDLSNNQLTKLSEFLRKLTQLETLHLDNNPDLKELPEALGEIPSLVCIEISGTQIAEEQRDAILARCCALRDKMA